MSGTLFVCGTPIGNLEDITLRVLRILKEADVIAAEDTRHTLKLLNYYEITGRLVSYHQHNEKTCGEKIVELLKNGKNVALVSDAGMPGVSDPGERLIRLCIDNDIPVTAAPGPTALITGLALSGLPAGGFVFEGFLPTGKKERVSILKELSAERRTIIFYEAPHHLVRTLRDIHEIFGERRVALARELTKKFEEIRRGFPAELLDYFETTSPKGEYVVVVEGISDAEQAENKKKQWEEIPIARHVAMYEEDGLSRKDAIKSVARDRGVHKNIIYKEMLE